MTARIITGSKQEIADEVARLDGQVREVIVFVDEPVVAQPPDIDIFAEMEPFAVRQFSVDDSREAVYGRGPGE